MQTSVIGGRYTPSELIALQNGWKRQCTLGQVPTDLLKRRFKNSLRSLGIWMPKRDLIDEFRWTYNPVMVAKYDSRMSNRHWKYLFFKRGGTIRDLKKIPRRDFIRVSGQPRLEWRGNVYRPDRTGKLIQVRPPNSRKRGRNRNTGQVAEPVKVQTSFGPIYVPPQKRNWFARADYQRAKDLTSMVRGTVTSNGDINVLGGRILPLEHHRKYWYFLRKRGYFKFSEHHPYGDEALCLPDPHSGLPL